MNRKGFSLIEIIAVMAVIAIMASIAVHKFVDLGKGASATVARDAVVKFNSAEIHHWTNQKLESGYAGDDQIFELVKKDLIISYNWKEISPTGGTITINSYSYKLVRSPSTLKHYAQWEVSNGA